RRRGRGGPPPAVGLAGRDVGRPARRDELRARRGPRGGDRPGRHPPAAALPRPSAPAGPGDDRQPPARPRPGCPRRPRLRGVAEDARRPRPPHPTAGTRRRRLRRHGLPRPPRRPTRPRPGQHGLAAGREQPTPPLLVPLPCPHARALHRTAHTSGALTMVRPQARSWALLTVLAVLLSLLGAGAAPADTGAETISFSLNRKRTAPSPLHGATVDGVVYPFLTGDAGVSAVSWWLDDPEMSGTPLRTDTTTPFDYAPGSVTHASAPFDTAELPDGEHTITARVTTTTNVVTRHAVFVTDNDVAALLTTSRPSVELAATQGGPAAGASVDVGTSDGVARAFTAETSANWLTVVPGAGTTPAQVSLSAATDLPVGTHQTEVVLTAADLPSVTVPVTLTV